MRVSEPASSNRENLLNHGLKPVEDRQQRARQRVDWYRNSFGDTVSLPSLPPEPTQLDPPLELPEELRPLRCRRRYLRTIQLLDDPEPVPSSDAHDGALGTRVGEEARRVSRARPSSGVRSKADMPFEHTLRRELSVSSGQKSRSKLSKATSHANLRLREPLSTNSRRDAKCSGSSSGQQTITEDSQGRLERDGDGDGEDRGEDEDDDNDEGSPDTDDQQGEFGGCSGTNETSIASQNLAKRSTLSVARSTAAAADGANSSPTASTKGRSRHTVNIIRLSTFDGDSFPLEDRPRRRRLSEEEADDIPDSEHYFGDRAREAFYARYRALYSRPYLFVTSDPSKTPSEDSNSGCHSPNKSPDDADDTRSSFVPKFPSTRQLQQVSAALKPASASTSALPSLSEAPHLPTRDALSPRSHLLAVCVTRPRLAVPFLLRAQPTTTFDFSFQSLGDEFMAAFAECLSRDLPFVEEVLVRDNRLSDAGLDALLRAISAGSSMLRLTRLDISQNEVGPLSAQTLRAYVVSPHCTLRTLLVDSADIDDRECAAFMTAFEKNLSIHTLCMSRNEIGKLESLNVVRPAFVTGGEAIASMLHANLVLAKLDLSWNFLRLGSSMELASSLRDNSTLVEINLAYNSCGDAGAMALGEALRCNHALRVLDLSANSVGVKGAMVLATAVRATRSLRSLQLNGNAIGREGGQALLVALTGNTSEFVLSIGLSGCNLSSRSSASSGDSGRLQTPAAATAIATTTPSSKSGKAPPATKNSANGAAGSDADVNVQSLPVYNALSARVFSPRDPSGRYQLSLTDAYDKMIVMELVRLATVRKGCRFLRVDHRVGSSKRSVALVRKEVSPKTRADKLPVLAASADDDNNLESKGIEALFSHIDHDNSGTIDRAEVLAVLNRLGLFPTDEQVARVFDRFDYNSSGFLEQREFAGFFFHAVFRLVDADNSGKIDAEEVEEALKLLGLHQYREQDVLEAIAMFDLTGDGEMEEAEFIEFIKGMLLDRMTRELLQPDSGPVSDGTDAPALAVVLLDASTQKPWVIPDDGQLELDFVYDREAFATSEEAHRVGKMAARGLEHLVHNIAGALATRSERDELFLVAVRDSEALFTAAQARELLLACGYLETEDLCVSKVAVLLPQMLTVREAQVLVSRTLTLAQRCRLKREMGSAYSVALGNPTAHYSFDLASGKDRIALRKLAEVAQSEKLFSRQRSGRGDTSQHGNWENFRNEELDGRSVVLSSAFFRALPPRGKLCFDYVSTTRPRKGTRPMSERRFMQLIDALQMDVILDAVDATGSRSNSVVSSSSGDGAEDKNTVGWARTRASVLKRGWRMLGSQPSLAQLSGATRDLVALQLVQIEAAVCDRWLSSAQAAQIVSCMPAAFRARPETARVLFSRVIDLDGFYRILDALGEDDQRFLTRALGWLNVVNPLTPERRYELDLSIWDEREMTKILVALAIAEPGENWINQSFSPSRGDPPLPGWKLPVRWEKEDSAGGDDGKDGGGVNRSGFLSLEYYAGQERGCGPDMAARRALLARTLCGTRLYCV